MPWATTPVPLFSPALSVLFALDDSATDAPRLQRTSVPVLRNWEPGVPQGGAFYRGGGPGSAAQGCEHNSRGGAGGGQQMVFPTPTPSGTDIPAQGLSWVAHPVSGTERQVAQDSGSAPSLPGYPGQELTPI